MRTQHYKKMVVGGPSWRVLRETLPQVTYEAGMARGFVLDKDSGPNRIAGRYIYTQLAVNRTLDKDTLRPKETPLENLVECRFELDMQKGLVMVEQQRSHAKALFEALDSIPECSVEFSDLNLNMMNLLFDVMRAYKKNQVKNLRIKDYLARENMLSSSTFKLIEPMEAEKLVERFKDQIQAWGMTMKLPDGVCSLRVTKQGTVGASDDTPKDVLLFVKDLLPAHDEAEVETVEVDVPGALKRVAKDLVNHVRNSGSSMTISAGGKSVTIK